MDYTEKQEKIQSPAIAIDGPAARSIRETKKLTQLYVATVVGVTTDTISRWENNRYPSIKRENAEKLAKALEVDLEQIIKADDATTEATVTAVPGAPLPPPPAHRSPWRWLGLLALVIIALFLLLLRQQQAGQVPTAERWLPAYAAPGANIPVKIVLHRQADDRRGVIVKERLPEGWTVVAASPPTMAQGSRQEIKWLVPGSSHLAQLLYTVQVPPDSTLDKSVPFSGTVILEERGRSRSKPVQGALQTRIAGLHWADQNGDQRIDDAEIMPAYYLTEEFKGLKLNWPEIEAIWNSNGYRWDQKTTTTRPLP